MFPLGGVARSLAACLVSEDVEEFLRRFHEGFEEETRHFSTDLPRHFVFAEYLTFARVVPFEWSSLSADSLGNVLTAQGHGEAGYMYHEETRTPMLGVAIPAGMVICGSGPGMIRALESGLRQHSWSSRKAAPTKIKAKTNAAKDRPSPEPIESGEGGQGYARCERDSRSLGLLGPPTCGVPSPPRIRSRATPPQARGARRRANPEDDLIPALIRAEQGWRQAERGRAPGHVFCIFFSCFPGWRATKTTVNLIAGGMLALLEHPEQSLRGSGATLR